MQELVVTVKGGHIQNRTATAKLFRYLPDGEYRMMIEPHKVRSLNQNDYYWGVVVPMIKNGLIDIGFEDIKSEIDAHSFMKEIFLHGQLDGSFFDTDEEQKISTTTLTTIQFTAYLEAIFQWAAEYLCVIIPSPVKYDVSFIAENDESVKATII